jgi:beta-galactosidase
MISLWALEAFAHGAEAVSYFRWRQLPFAQEQMHAGLLRPDRSHAEGFAEAGAVAALIRDVEWPATTRGDVAIVFDYESAWAWKIQPQGEHFDYFSLVFDIYRGLRQLGLSVDFLSPAMAASQMDDYAICLVPGTFTCDEALADALSATSSRVILGPRTASKTGNFAIPDTLAPLLPEAISPARITHVESLAAGLHVEMNDGQGYVHRWREFATPVGDAAVLASTIDGRPALLRRGQLDYLCGWPDPQCLDRILRDACNAVGIATIDMPDGIRLRRAGNKGFVMNYGDNVVDLTALADNISVLHGSEKIPPSGFAIIAFDASA